MDRLFLDANVLFSAAYRVDAGVTRLWRLRETTLHSSEYAVDEGRRNLGEPDQLERLDVLMRDVVRLPAGTMNAASRQGVQLPEMDWPIVAGALAARATHLITGDLQHFGPHFGKLLFGVDVLSPAAYLRSRRDDASES
ncbi:MAG: DNA-binding protein [Trueperaceae bacterium]|nr:DNA-binding protein [Trueperaceae bacterium]